MSVPPPQTACPPGNILAAIAQGDCNDAAAVRHADACPACRAVVEEFRSNQGFLNDFLPAEAGRAAIPPLTDLADPALIDEYQIVGTIGRGGQGVVYKAIHSVTTREVALKLPLHGELVSGRDRLRFESEIKIVAGMRHPYVVTVYDSGIARDGRFFIAMEYVRGLRLDEWAARVDQRSGTARQAVRAKIDLFAKVCDAVQYAHQRMIMHRDLKPSNILVDDDDNPRLLDFGIARPVFRAGLGPTVTGQFAGTPAYASPEQLAGHPDQVDLRTDIYSLGVVLFELLFGRLPYPADGPLPQLLEQVAHTEPQFPAKGEDSGRGAAADFDLRTIVLKALAKDRERRYQTVRELAEDLRRWLAGEAVSARRDSTWYVLRKMARKRRGPLSAAALVLLVLIAGAAATTLFALREASARAKAEARGRETDQVAEFQASMLTGIDAEAMGRGLMAAIRGEVDAALSRRGASPEAISTKLAELDSLLASVNPTNIAVRSLEENIVAKAQRTAGEQFKDQPLVEARLLATVSDVYLRLGLPALALGPAERALEIRERILGAEHADTLVAVSYNGVALQTLARYAEAEPFLWRALEGNKRVLGPDHAKTLASISMWAEQLRRTGKLTEAEPFYQQVLDSNRHLLGDDHPETLQSLRKLGLLFDEQGQYGRAEANYREALAGARRAMGADDRFTIVALGDLGQVLHAQGKVEEAETCLREAVERARRVLGDSHADTLAHVNNLASVLIARGALDEAETYRREVLQRLRDTLGDDHPSTLTAMNNMGMMLRAQGKLAEAESYYTATLAALRRTLGDDHPFALSSLNNLGMLLFAQKKFDEAESLLREAVDARRRVLGSDHPDTLAAFNNLGGVMEAMGKLADAEVWYRAVVDGHRRVSGESDWMAGAAGIKLGRVLTALGRYNEAEEELLRAEAILAAAPGAPAKRHAQCMETIVALYEAWNAAKPGADLQVKVNEWRAKSVAAAETPK